jgi:hypothetical protein
VRLCDFRKKFGAGDGSIASRCFDIWQIRLDVLDDGVLLSRLDRLMIRCESFGFSEATAKNCRRKSTINEVE